MKRPSDRYVLALDAASPQVSVALARGDELLAVRDEAIARSSRRLLEMIDEVLREAGVEREALGGIVALRGPGSFTGLRVGLATTLGLHMALRVPATALDTLQVLAAALSEAADDGTEREGASRADGVLLAAVDALRGEWTVQPFAGTPPRPLAESATLPPTQIPFLLERFRDDAPPPAAPATVVGFGVSALAAAPGWPATVRCVEPGPLAPAALRLLHRLQPPWAPALLTAPIYARPPAVTTPKSRTQPLGAVPAGDRR